MRSFKHLVLLQELELDGNVTAQSLIFVLMDLILLLRRINTRYGHGVPWSHVQFFQIGSVSVKLQPAWRGGSYTKGEQRREKKNCSHQFITY